jgi:DNA-binding CsgD family transcriptional regulator
VNDVFIGREAELATVSEIAERVRAGRPWMVVVEGESGIGKTALIRHALAPLTSARVLWARADTAESDLDYGVVGQLLRGLSEGPPGAGPLAAGAAGPAPAPPFAVGAELLRLVGELLADGPVVIVVDDVQWADRRSVEALSFMLRRLSADAVLAVFVVRGSRDDLEDGSRRLLTSLDRRARVSLSGLERQDVAPLAAALGAETLDPTAIERIYESTGGHTLYLQTVLSDPEGRERLGGGRSAVPTSLAVAIGDQLAVLPAPTRSLLEMLAVLDARTPLALVAEGAGVATPRSGVEPAVRAGLVSWWPEEATCPVVIRHALQRDAIYAGTPAEQRRALHRVAAGLVDEEAAWRHRVAALDGPDGELAGELERLAEAEAGGGRLALAATHLLWASEVTPERAERESRLQRAVLHLMLTDETRGFGLSDAVVATRSSPLRSCVLGSLAFSSGQLGSAESHFGEAFSQARDDPGSEALAALAANRLAGTYTLLGKGEEVMAHGRFALRSGCLDAAATSQTRTLVAVGALQVGGPREALAELGHLDADPRRVGAIDVDGLSFRGVFRLLAGDLVPAVADLSASVRLSQSGATFTFGPRAYFYLALAQYLAGSWDDELMTADQGFAAWVVHPRHYDLPLLHLAEAIVPAGRGATTVAEEHASRAEAVAAELDYGQERLYAGMARAVVCQAAGDFAGMVGALGHWHDEATLDGRSRTYSVLWRPLLVEGLLGAGRVEEAELALQRLLGVAQEVAFMRPGLAWLEGWLAEEQGDPGRAKETYRQFENEGPAGTSPVYQARLLLAHGRLLRRTGQRREAIELLRRANDLYAAMGAQPFAERARLELVACGLPGQPDKRGSVLDMTSRESEVAHLVGRGMTNKEIAAELFVTPNTVEYHLGNVYAKLGLKGRQQLRRYLVESRGAVSA